MKILQVTAIDFTLKKFLTPLIDGLQEAGFDVHTACHCGQIGTELQREGYKLHHIPFSRNLNVLNHLVNVWRLYKLIRREKFDSIHAHTPVASIIARLAARLAGVPLIVYTAHGFYFHENMNKITYTIAFLIEKVWGKYLSDYLFFQSLEDYDMAIKNKFNRKDQLVHIGNGVSAEKFQPQLYNRDEIRRKYQLLDSDIVFTFVGRLVKEKGIDELIEAYSMLNSKYPQVKLFLIGGNVEGDRDGIDLEQQLQRLTSEARQHLFLLGLRNDIPDLLSASDVFVLPSYREGMPRSIIEAMSMGKPIIATNIRGCREEVFPEHNGYLCEVKNSRDLADKMELLIHNSEKRKLFGENSRELFLKEFDEKVVVQKQIDIFKKEFEGGRRV